VKTESKEDDSVFTGIETYLDSESPGKSCETSQEILNCIGRLVSRFCGATANVIESISRNVLFLGMPCQERNQRNGLKQPNLKFSL
jgi:hypothetical protein